MLKVIGYERIKGDKSKSSGKPYDLDKIYALEVDEVIDSNGYGQKCREIVYNRQYNGPLRQYPSLGDYIIVKGRNGWVDDVRVVDAAEVDLTPFEE